MKFSPNDKKVLAFLLNNQENVQFKLNDFNIGMKMEKSRSTIYESLRKLKAYGLISKSIGGSYHIPKNQKEEVLSILKEGDNEAVL